MPPVTPVAAFLRGMTAWMVIDTAIPIDPAKLKTELGDLPNTVDVASGDNATIIRIGLKQPEEIAVREEGVDLKFVLAPESNTTQLGIGFARDVSDNGMRPSSPFCPAPIAFSPFPIRMWATGSWRCWAARAARCWRGATMPISRCCPPLRALR